MMRSTPRRSTLNWKSAHGRIGALRIPEVTHVFLDWSIYGNSAKAWLLALGAAALTYAALRLIQPLLVRSLKRLTMRTANEIDDILIVVVRATRSWVLAIMAIAVGSSFLVLPEATRAFISQLAILVFLVQLGIWGAAGIRAYVSGHSQRKVDVDGASVTTIRAIGFLSTMLLWAILILVALDNVGIEITALVAGLGIGGIAIALAVQNVLGDLFASLSIVLDKPFVYGDFIVVGDMAGTVENIGLKTTRVRSLTGEQLVFSNSDLLQSRVRNYKRMQERRVVSSLGVIYQTPAEKLRQIPGMLREIVEAEADVRFDRAHFQAFGDSALKIELVYYILSSDYALFMDHQESINLKILERFEAAGLDFAYPTQTLFVAGGELTIPAPEPAPAEA